VRGSHHGEAPELPPMRPPREERPGPGHPHEVRGTAAPREGLRGPGEDLRPQCDPGHRAGHHPQGGLVATARVHPDPREDTLRSCGLCGRDRGQGGWPSALDMGLHNIDGYSHRRQEEQGEEGPQGSPGEGLQGSHRLRRLE